MVAERRWCELCRFDDLMLARAVATSIAAMEFDVRLCAADGPAPRADEAHTGFPPYVVEVFGSQWQPLAEVLDQIIDEQQEFDRAIAQRQTGSRNARIVTIITLTGAADLLLLFGLLEM